MKHIIYRITIGIAIVMGINGPVAAQPGKIDTSFDPGAGANSGISSVAIQPDGKIIIAGSFTAYDNIARTRIARLNPDGSLDTSFDPGTGTNLPVTAMALRPDGKIIIGGAFSDYNGTVCKKIALLNADGSLDAGFAIGTNDTGFITAVAVQPDNKIIIGGRFNSYSSVPRNNIARLNADGSLDAGFSPGSGLYIMPPGGMSVPFPARTITVQSDGKIVVGGDFIKYNDIPINRVARINSNGSLDTSFHAGTGASAAVMAAVIQPDGKIIIGGSFTSYNGISRNRLARINPDGSLDVSFNPGTGPDLYMQAIALQQDGKILIGGAFTHYNGIARNRLARLNPDGSLDTAFNPGAGADEPVRQMALQQDGKIVIAGDFITYDATACNRIARISVLTLNGPVGMCVGDNATYTGLPSGGVYSSTNPAIATVSPSGIVTGIASGTDTIIYTLGSMVVRKAVTVSIPPVVSQSTGPAALCEGNSITLNNTTPDGVWTSSNTAIAVVGNTTGIVTGQDAGNVDIIYTVTQDGCSSGQSLPLTVYDNPEPVITNNGGILVTNATGAYSWALNGTVIPGATQQSYTPDENGSYTVTVTTVHDCSRTSAPYLLSTVAVKPVAGIEPITVFPNPATGIVHIDAPFTIKIVLSSLEGKIIISKDNVREINVAPLHPGTYIITVYDMKGTALLREKLIRMDK